MTPTREEVERLAKRFDVNAADWRWDEDHHAARDMLRALLARAEAAETLVAVNLRNNKALGAANVVLGKERDAARAELARLREALEAAQRIIHKAEERFVEMKDQAWADRMSRAYDASDAALATEARDE